MAVKFLSAMGLFRGQSPAVLHRADHAGCASRRCPRELIRSGDGGDERRAG